MLGLFATVVSILAGLVAVFAFGLGVTRTARLRRREQLFREALGGLSPDDPARSVVHELHRAALAEIVARQLTSPWRAVLPWMLGLAMIGLFTQTGYRLSDYLASEAEWDYSEFVFRVLGDTGFGEVSVLIAVLLFGRVFAGYVLTVVGRAKTGLDFFRSGQAERARSYSEWQAEVEVALLTAGRDAPEVHDALSERVPFGKSLVPGVFALFVGLFIGQEIWLQEQEGDRLELVKSLGASVWIVALGLAVSFGLMMWVCLWVWVQVREYSLPTSFPQRHGEPVAVPRRRPHRSMRTRPEGATVSRAARRRRRGRTL